MSAAVLCALACSDVYAYRALLKGCGLHAVVCGVIYLYPQWGELHTLRMSNLIRFKVGFADHRAHPDGITGLPASLGTVCQSSI